jgi:hypothetical protein
MTPKEKAQELVLKYLRIENTNDWWSKVPAKQCALIAVDEIINNVLVGIDLPSTWGNYWKQVKTEIEKL